MHLTSGKSNDTDPVGKLVESLARNPDRFRDSGGYERLSHLLESGCPPDAIKSVLRGDGPIVGDLLWTVTELEDVAPFVSEAVSHLSNEDVGTAAYAMEVVLRGSHHRGQLGAALERLRSCDVAVCEHAARTLAGEGLARLLDILAAVGDSWRTLAKELSGKPLRSKLVENLVTAGRRDHQVIGVALATLAYERDESYLDCLVRAEETWVHEYGEWLQTRARGRSSDRTI